MPQAVVQSLHGRKTVTRFNVIEVDNLNFESLGDRVVHHIRTSSRNCHKYLLLHHPSADCAQVGGRGRPPHTFLLAAPARAAAAHALVATAVSHHDRAADVATGCVSEVDYFGEGVGGVKRRARRAPRVLRRGQRRLACGSTGSRISGVWQLGAAG